MKKKITITALCESVALDPGKDDNTVKVTLIGAAAADILIGLGEEGALALVLNHFKRESIEAFLANSPHGELRDSLS